MASSSGAGVVLPSVTFYWTGLIDNGSTPLDALVFEQHPNLVALDAAGVTISSQGVLMGAAMRAEVYPWRASEGAWAPVGIVGEIRTQVLSRGSVYAGGGLGLIKYLSRSIAASLIVEESYASQLSPTSQGLVRAAVTGLFNERALFSASFELLDWEAGCSVSSSVRLGSIEGARSFSSRL